MISTATEVAAGIGIVVGALAVLLLLLVLLVTISANLARIAEQLHALRLLVAGELNTRNMERAELSNAQAAKRERARREALSAPPRRS